MSQDFVSQEFFEFLTVRETLDISAALTLPESWTTTEKRDRVETLLTELDLLGAADTIIGSSLGGTVGGISGGERRRLCVAMELMNDPQLLLLDEPTSGLDAASALMLVSLLKKLAKRGKTIVCVIHQPRASIMSMFSSIMLLGAGRVIYYGPSCNFRTETDPLRDFFREAGHACPAFENPADHILDVINTVQSDAVKPEQPELKDVEQRNSAVHDLSELYRNTPLFKKMMALSSRGEGVPLPTTAGGSISRRYATSWCTQFRVIFGRTFKLKLRDPMCFGTVVAGITVMALLHGSIYFDMVYGDWRNRISGIAMYISMTCFMCFDVLMLWPSERAIYLRDQRAGCYCPSAFYVARSLAEVPAHMITGTLGGIIVYLMYGLTLDWATAFWFCILTGLVIVTSGSVMIGVGGLSRGYDMSNQIAMPLLTIVELFSGWFLTKEMAPSMWHWVYDVNFLYHTMNYLSLEELRGMGVCASIATLSNPNFEGAFTVNSNGTAAAGTNGTVEVFGTMDCDDALAFAGFVPELSLAKVLWWHLLTNVFFRGIGFVGLKCCWTGRSCRQNCACL